MYIIKKHYEATETNENFKGEKQVWYCGKQGADCRADTNEGTNYLKSFIKYHGYATKAGATKAFNSAKDLAEWETKAGHWAVSCELIKVEIV
jgi:hypothetical protein